MKVNTQVVEVQGRKLLVETDAQGRSIINVRSVEGISVAHRLNESEWVDLYRITGLYAEVKIVYECTRAVWHVHSDSFVMAPQYSVTVAALEVLRNPEYRRAVQAVLNELNGN
jgi:hypothetical protein